VGSSLDFRRKGGGSLLIFDNTCFKNVRFCALFGQKNNKNGQQMAKHAVWAHFGSFFMIFWQLLAFFVLFLRFWLIFGNICHFFT
jgi:hypothetical protein